MDWREVADGGRIGFDPEFLQVEETTFMFAWLRDHIPWHQEKIFNRPAPRLNAFFADIGVTYRYSGILHTGNGWLPELASLIERVATAASAPFNSILLNYYRTGQDSMSYHTDAEPELGLNPVVATLSFGHTRRMLIKHMINGETLTYELTPGSLLVMAGTLQHHWRHAIPKTKKVLGPRISLTFRQILKPPTPVANAMVEPAHQST